MAEKRVAWLEEVDLCHDGLSPEPRILGTLTTVQEFAGFKYGNGLVGRRYGVLLAELLNNELKGKLGRRLYITSAAYRTAPPAAQTLVRPFCVQVESLARDSSVAVDLVPFKVSKTKMEVDDVTALTFAERVRLLRSRLELPCDLDLKGAALIVLDDIKATGLREAALEMLFESADVKSVSYYYVLRSVSHHTAVNVEESINRHGLGSRERVERVCLSPSFVPNVRFCKFILSQDASWRDALMGKLPAHVSAEIDHYIQQDDLNRVIRVVP